MRREHHNKQSKHMGRVQQFLVCWFYKVMFLFFDPIPFFSVEMVFQRKTPKNTWKKIVCHKNAWKKMVFQAKTKTWGTLVSNQKPKKHMKSVGFSTKKQMEKVGFSTKKQNTHTHTYGKRWFFNQKPKKHTHGKRWLLNQKPKKHMEKDCCSTKNPKTHTHTWKALAFEPKTKKTHGKRLLFSQKPKHTHTHGKS